MSIKPKTGKCLDCGPDVGERSLISGRCQTHYWQHRADVKAAARQASGISINKQAQKKAMDLWFVNQIKQLPKRCENCNEPLIVFAPWAARSFVAHIVPKRHFISVATHPLNRVFLCLQCHTNYDNWSEAKVQRMPVISTCKERFLAFADEIPASEWRYLPDWLIFKDSESA